MNYGQWPEASKDETDMVTPFERTESNQGRAANISEEHEAGAGNKVIVYGHSFALESASSSSSDGEGGSSDAGEADRHIIKDQILRTRN